MKWNWQKSTWPNFTYRNKCLDDFEAQYLRQSGLFLGTIKHVKNEDTFPLERHRFLHVLLTLGVILTLIEEGLAQI